MPYPNPRPVPRNGPGSCTRCDAAVIWCLNANGNTQAINRERVAYGNQAVRQDSAGRWHVRQLNRDRPSLEGSEALHYPHAPTCSAPATRTPRRLSAAKVRTGVRPVRWQQR
ncbi:hypothetical protein [Streptomyces sp. NBC_00827]|uniref:hypothetical protein n=1 Tax=Streptomyces sp. NBC_00827 TaxID=2903677 RepID=UPI0038700A50|nr:hypothetical protein OG569_02260 [Streptomyces sp. NBC_00827]